MGRLSPAVVTAVVCAVVLLAVAVPAAAGGTAYKYPSYGEVVDRLHALEQEHPGFVRVWSAQDEYGVPSAGTCTDGRGQSTPCKQWFVAITDEATLSVSPHRPEVFFSGNLHGNEEVGPPTLIALAELLVRNAASFTSSQPRLGPMGNLWLQQLVQTRVIVMLPISNAVGYSRDVREELGVDPNRDFPYNREPQRCMVTAVARALNEVWTEHMFQVAITYHGGMQAIAYEWGAPNHASHNSESPDEVAQARIGSKLAAYAGAFRGQRFPAGRLNTLVYPVTGGMEDWAYAAGWDSDAVRPCTPTSFGGYPASKTDYARNGHAEAFRAFNILVETWDAKKPAQAELGTDEAPLKVSGPGDGHVPRNMRLALQLIDIAQPWLRFVRVGVDTLPADSTRRRAQSVVCSSSGGSRRRLRAEVVAPDARRPRFAPAAGESPAATHTATSYGLGATQFRNQYQHWVEVNSCDHAVKVDLGWDVGGGYTVDSTQLIIGRWPADVDPSELFKPAVDSDWSDVAAWKDLVAGRADAMKNSALYLGDTHSGHTRWMETHIADFSATPYSTRFQACTVLSSQHPTPPPRSTGDYARVDSYLAVAVGTLDSDWAHTNNPTPNLPPQSHLVNARTNPQWSKSNNGKTIVGRTVFLSDPMFIAVAHKRAGCFAAPAPSPSPTVVSVDKDTHTHGSHNDHAATATPSPTAAPSQLAPSDVACSGTSDTTLLETGASPPGHVKVKAPPGLVAYSVVVTMLLAVTLAVMYTVRRRSRRALAQGTSPTSGAFAVTPAPGGVSGGRRRRGYVDVDSEASDAEGDSHAHASDSDTGVDVDVDVDVDIGLGGDSDSGEDS